MTIKVEKVTEDLFDLVLTQGEGANAQQIRLGTVERNERNAGHVAEALGRWIENNTMESVEVTP